VNQIKKDTKREINGINEKMIKITDKERTERILKDSKHSDINKDEREKLLINVKKLLLNNTNDITANINRLMENQKELTNRNMEALKNTTSLTVDEKINAIKVNITSKLDNIRSTTGTIANEAKINANNANSNAKLALSKISNVVETSTKQVSELSTELRNMVIDGANKQKQSSSDIKADLSSRLISIESSLRRSFEEQASSLRALTQANLAAEASVRLREDTRVRKEVDLRLKEQQKWVGEFTEYKAEKIGRKLGKLVRAEALARQSSTRQVHREIAYEMDKSHAQTQVRSALDSIIGQIIESDASMKMNMALNKLNGVVNGVDQKIKKEILTASKDSKKHLAQNLRKVQTQFTKAKRATDDLNTSVEVKYVLNRIIGQIVESNNLNLLKDTTTNIMKSEIHLTKILSNANQRGKNGLTEQFNLIKESIEEEALVRGTEDKRIDVANRTTNDEVREAISETKTELNELRKMVENYHSNDSNTSQSPPVEEQKIEWEEHKDEESGDTYWKDPVSGRQTYEDPT
jgi:hypothetical protein